MFLHPRNNSEKGFQRWQKYAYQRNVLVHPGFLGGTDTGEVSPFQVYLRKSFNNVPFRKLTTICFLKNNIQFESLKIMINRHVNFMFWTDIN